MPTKDRALHNEHSKRSYEKQKDAIALNNAMNRIMTGAIPYAKTLERFRDTLTPDFINELRREAGHEPIAFSEETLGLSTTASSRLNTIQGKSKPEVSSSPKTTLTLDELEAHFQTLLDDPAEGMNSQGTMTGRINNIKRLLDYNNCNADDDLVKCLKDPTLLEMIIKTYTNPNTRKTYINSLLYAIDHHPVLKENVKGADRQRIADAYENTTHESQAYNDEKQKEEVERFDLMLERIDMDYPGTEVQLLMHLYDNATMRDDFNNLYLRKTPGENYIDRLKGMLHMEKYNKTQGRYGQARPVKLGLRFMQLLNASLKKHPRDTLLSVQSRTIFNKLGKGHGVDFLRHSKITTELDGENIRDPEKRRELAERMKHSPMTQLNYLRR